MPTAARVLLATIIVGTILIWGGVGWVWFGQHDQFNLSPLAQSLSSLPLISRFVLTITPTPPAAPPLPTLSVTLATFTDDKFSFSFNYPETLQLEEVTDKNQRDPNLDIVKQYSLYSSTNQQLNLIDVSLIKGDYWTPRKSTSEDLHKFDQSLESEKVQYSQLRTRSNALVDIMEYSLNPSETYIIGYYPYTDNYYLMIEIQPGLGWNKEQAVSFLLNQSPTL